MPDITKSKEELAIIELRRLIIKQMKECVTNNEAMNVSSFATALHMLPKYLDYEE